MVASRTALLIAFVIAGREAMAGEIVPTAQDREVAASAESILDLWATGTSPTFPTFDPPSFTQTSEASDVQSAMDLSDFAATALATGPGVIVVPTAGTATASLSSTISATELTATASVGTTTDAYVISAATLAQLNAFLPGPTYVLGFGHDRTTGAASYSVSFDVASETPYALTGSVAMQAGDPLALFVGTHEGAALFRLTGPAGVIHEAVWDQIDDGCATIVECLPLDLVIDESGMLSPGSYTLEAGVTGVALGNCGDIQGFPPCWQPTNSGSFDLTLSVDGGASPGCGPTPLAGCVAADKASVEIREVVPGKENLRLSLKRLGAEVLQGDFGDPVAGTTRFDACVYDEADALVAELALDRAGASCGSQPCWNALSTKGYRYRDGAASASGVRKLVARGGPSFAGTLKVQAGNDAAAGETAMPTGITAQLEGDSSATVQVVTSDAACFEAELTEVKRAEANLFRATGG